MTTVTFKEARRAHLAELLAEAARGEEVVIEDEGRSTFRLVPSEEASKKKRGLIGSAKGQIWMSDDFDEPLEDFEEYMS